MIVLSFLQLRIHPEELFQFISTEQLTSHEYFDLTGIQHAILIRVNISTHLPQIVDLPLTQGLRLEVIR